MLVRWRTQDAGVPPAVPRNVVWSDHARVKAQILGVARSDVQDAILDGHQDRARNTGAAEWPLTVGRLAVAYNRPSMAMP